MIQTFGINYLELLVTLNIVKSMQDFNEILDFLAKLYIFNYLWES